MRTGIALAVFVRLRLMDADIALLIWAVNMFAFVNDCIPEPSGKNMFLRAGRRKILLARVQYHIAEYAPNHDCSTHIGPPSLGKPSS
jgi:hypothetical protein